MVIRLGFVLVSEEWPCGAALLRYRFTWPDDLGEPPNPGWGEAADDRWCEDVPELAA